jgi:hypothetical protein
MRVLFQDYDVAPLRSAVPLLANRLDLRRSQLLFHFGYCTLRTLATESTGKLASVCIDLRVVLSTRNGYVREAVVDRQRAFFGIHLDWHSIRSRSGRTERSLQNSSFADRKLIPRQLVFSLNGTNLGLAKLHVTNSKDETGPASGP